MRPACSTVTFSGHAVTRMFERNITKEEVMKAIALGEVIRFYPDDRPYPSCLLLWKGQGRVLHVVLARDEDTGACYIITVYQPSLEIWDSDYRNRRK